MSSPFQDAAIVASAAVDAIYGEPFTYQPMAQQANPNDRAIADPDRAALTITAAFYALYGRAAAGPARTPNVLISRPGEPSHASTRPQISFDASQLPYEARRGDRLIRQSDSVVFVLAEPQRADPVRILADVNELRNPR